MGATPLFSRTTGDISATLISMTPVTQEPTILSRYEIDFNTKMQGNLGTGNSREVRLVYLDMRFT